MHPHYAGDVAGPLPGFLILVQELVAVGEGEDVAVFLDGKQCQEIGGEEQMPSVLQDLCSVGLQSGMGIGHCLGGAPIAPQRLNVIGNEADAVVGAVGFLQFGERAVEELQGTRVFSPAQQHRA